MKLLEKLTINELELNNRIIMAPMTRSRAANDEAAPTDMHVEYYSQRASAGLIITEATIVSPQGNGYINVPGVFTQTQIDGWKKVTNAVHEKDGKIFSQLWHVGRMSHPDFHDGELPVAPSAINPDADVYTVNGPTKTVTPRALETNEIKQTIEDFKNAGENAMKAGFDGIEVHAANGYLFQQFFNNCSNTRNDKYGGSIENNARILFETLDALKEVMPEEKIGVRLNPMLHGMSGITVDSETSETFDYIVNRLNSYKLAYLHILRMPPMEVPHIVKDVIGHYRTIYNGFLIANGAYDKENGEVEIKNNRADAIAYGRPFIANPDLPERFEKDWELAEPDPDTFYTKGEKGYTDYPTYKDSQKQNQ